MEEEEVNIVFIQPSIKNFLKCVTVIPVPFEIFSSVRDITQQ